MDREQATKFLREFETFVQDFATVNKLEVILGRAKFGDSGLTISKINFKDPNAKPTPMDTAVLARFGIRPEWIGKVFTGATGKNFVLLGVNPRRSRYPLIMRSVADGKQVYGTKTYLRFPIY